MKVDKDAIAYAGRVIATNAIWRADDEDEPGRREAVASILAGTVVHAYLWAMEDASIIRLPAPPSEAPSEPRSS